jgi:bifunctional ADP-heptose synthase (sugar kinase/adenylyltransferase)
MLVCGDAMVDLYWFGEVPRISPEAPVPVVKLVRSEEQAGAAANVARNCEAMGGQVTSAGA